MDEHGRKNGRAPGNGLRQRGGERSVWGYSVAVFVTSLVVYLLFGYGGIRSPDSEMVYRTARALAFERTFALDEGLEGWSDFALVRGVDGKQYSLFQPLEPLLLAPWVRLAEALSRTDGMQALLLEPPGSHYVALNIGVILGLPPDTPRPHIARALVMPFGALVSAAGAVFFFLIVQILIGSRKAALLTTVIYAFGTLTFWYATTLFKEPLVNVFVLGSLYFLLRAAQGRPRAWGWLAGSGFAMSCAVATHLMAIPLVPFYALLAGILTGKQAPAWRRSVYRMTIWSAAAIPVLALLAWFNVARFGGVLNTGYGLAVGQHWWQRFVNPLVGLSGLLFSPGKGLVLYCPVVVLGFIQWRRLHRACRVLSVVLLSMILARTLFASSYHDWHGGFCMGPRFMVALIPFMLIPVGFWIRSIERQPSRGGLTALFFVTWLSVSQQIYFALGELFSFLHHIKWEAGRAGIDVFKDFFLFFTWQISPLLHLLEGNRGPYLMQKIPLSNVSLWLVWCVAAAAIVLALVRWLGHREQEGDRP